MADDRRPWAALRHLTAEDVANRGFATSFRGFDTAEVRDYLTQVAEAMRALRDVQQDLERRLREAEERAAHPEIDESMLMAALGEETARLLRSAHEAAADIRAKAEENAERMLKEASAEIAELRGQAEGLLARRTAEADEAAAAIRDAAHGDAETVSARAREEAEEILAAARRQAEAVVGEAADRRTELLRDLTRKRRVANIQVEQLRAGRERLLDTYGLVRRTLDEVTTALERADDDARTAAFAAGNRAARELDAAGDDLEELLAGTEEASSGSPTAGAAPAEAAAPSAAKAAAPSAPVPPAAKEPAAEEGGRAGGATTGAVADSTSSEPAVAKSGEARAADPTAGRPRTLPSIAAPRATDPVDPDRPTSSLRIIRGPKPDDAARPRSRSKRDDRGSEPDTGAPAADSEPVSPSLSLVEPTSDIEGVRVIPAAEKPAAPAPAAQPADPVARTRSPLGVPPADPEPVDMGDVPPVGPTDVPMSDDAPLPARPPAATTAAQSPAPAAADSGKEPAEKAEPGKPGEPAAAKTGEAGTPAPAAAPTPVAAGSGQVTAGADADTEARPAVDDLFARIRAGREQAVALAREVLSSSEADGGGGPPAAAAGEGTGPVDDAAAQRTADDGLLERRAERIDPIAVQLGRRLKRALQDDQNDALDRLRSVRGGPTIEAAFGQADQQRARFEMAARVFIEEAAVAGAEFESGSAALSEAEVAQIVNDLAESIVGPLRRQLEQRLHEAVAVGDDQSTVVERVGASYREWKSQRIERLASDHVHRAFCAGAFANIEPSTMRRWVVDDLDGACPDCDDNALAGPVPVGEAFPTGQLHPPAHAGCRCLLGPPTV